jgi:hypothetical protein
MGRQLKLALARRDPHAIRIHLEPLPASVRNDVLLRADRYAADDRSRQVSSSDARLRCHRERHDAAVATDRKRICDTINARAKQGSK